MTRFLCLIATEDRIFNTRRALKELEISYPNDISGKCYSVWSLNNHPEELAAVVSEIDDYDFAVVYFHGGAQSIPDFNKVWDKLSARMPVFFESSHPEEIAELMPTSHLDPEEYRIIREYFFSGGVENVKSMFLYIANSRFGFECEVAPPNAPVEEGYYMPCGILTDEEELSLRRMAAEGDKPVVGIIIHQNAVIGGNTRHIDAIINKLDELGAISLPLFTQMANDEDDCRGILHAMERHFVYNGKKLPDVILVMTGFSLTHMSWPGDGEREMGESVFSLWDVPAMQVMTTRYSPEDYEKLPQGLDSMSLSMNIFQPELDGQIITVPCAAMEIVTEEGVDRKITKPLPDRVERICRLAINWSKLRRLPQDKKKVAILFNTLPGNDKIGCAEGLDTFESVYNMVKRLKEQGVYTEYDFENGQDIINRITSGLTNDLRWTSLEAAAEKAAGVINRETWQTWFDKQNTKVKDELLNAWGRAPGSVMTDDDNLFIPGIINGNVFIGLQPSRAFGEKAAELYHSTDSTPPYSYIAFYRWLDECFGVNSVWHIGTHGSLEWLPGKEVGLSRNCYPDIALESIPNLYPYHIGVTGEGIQAKRRSHAVILDHMPPSLDEAEAYEGLAVIDEALKEYHQAKQVRPAQVPSIAQRIYDLSKAINLTNDLGITDDDFAADQDKTIDDIHIWMGEVKNSVVKDGLHIFGKVPEGKLYDNLLRMLVRARNGNISSLNDSILIAQGYNPDEVRDNPTKDFNGLSGLMVLDGATASAKRITTVLSKNKYDVISIDNAVKAENFPGLTEELRRTLRFMCEVVSDKINHITDEMDNLMAGNNGRFVPPSLGGNPTRGNVSILPTGRNFYASDPAQIPSRVAWDIGCKLARQMLKQYEEQEGGYPESIAMVIWAGNTLKTCGEDFAECLNLMGVRPVYLGQTTRVLGVEVIPLDELGRPRIDVTLRISGLFRDMYPNLIRLMDEAVKKVAVLDEPIKMNYIRKHFLEDVEKFTSEGLPEDSALDQAYTRVYGSAPGCYGTAVSKIIDSRQWTDFSDLAKVFEAWSSYAYTAKEHGEKHVSTFKRRMSQVAVTIKNESTAEYDMLDSDDFYAYHGGLIACVKANSGKVPMSICGHSDDPDRPVTRTVSRETARVVRSKVLNPKWLDGLKRHGFKGAQELSTMLDHLFGWDATAEVAEDWMYQSITEKFLFDEDTRKWMEEVNRWAVHNMSERLLEANQRGMWETDEQTLKRLQNIYMQAEGNIEEVSL